MIVLSADKRVKLNRYDHEPAKYREEKAGMKSADNGQNTGNNAVRVALETLGCKLNQAETEQISRDLVRAGCRIVQSGEKADIYLLNTCTVTHIADRKSRHLLRMARRRNPSVFIIAAGCYAQRDPAGLSNLEGVDLVIGNEEKAKIPQILDKQGYLIAGKPNPGPDISGRTRSFIKIQDGCNSYCTYCIVPFVRGHEKSLAPERVIAEIRERSEEGCREAVLTGTEIGRYSSEGLDLKGLIERILAETGIERLRLSSLQPREISPGLLSLWGDPRLCPHFHISLQSGNERVLQRMSRRYTPAEYAEVVDRIRCEIPSVSITTDIIAGFPGETEDEFRESCDFCAGRHFARIHVFPFSPREGTKAFSMPEQIPHNIKKRRCEALLELAKSSLIEYSLRFLGETRAVLFEQRESGMWTGLTDNYIKVYSRSETDLSNRIVDVKLQETRMDGMTGIPCETP
ncbi:MAG: tRNA (N(6)-L-threonylcarbamoyladenosine(37)-C(2))-methylthiotransferase MtaB [Dehalococcoidales bacterium]|nr:tRNA (N(6)-L-threonylcarbamoyladenosine(37)-C(2))-methylthiotransferase MtaB [Dehalococcoidales bacterium]